MKLTTKGTDESVVSFGKSDEQGEGRQVRADIIWFQLPPLGKGWAEPTCTRLKSMLLSVVKQLPSQAVLV